MASAMLSCRLPAGGIQLAQQTRATLASDNRQPACTGVGFCGNGTHLSSYALIRGYKGVELQRRAGGCFKASRSVRQSIRATAVEAEVEQWTADKLIDASEDFKGKALIKSRKQVRAALRLLRPGCMAFFAVLDGCSYSFLSKGPTKC